MIKVPLVGEYTGQYALVDDCDIWVLKFRWKGHRGSSGIVYAQVSSRKEGFHDFSLHRLVLGLKKGDMGVDHHDGNGLNCRRNNLRLATQSQNSMNRRKYKRMTSSYKGVSWFAPRNKWMVWVYKKGHKRLYAGIYISEIEAAKAYDRKAEELFGEFARLNFPEKRRE